MVSRDMAQLFQSEFHGYTVLSWNEMHVMSSMVGIDVSGGAEYGYFVLGLRRLQDVDGTQMSFGLT